MNGPRAIEAIELGEGPLELERALALLLPEVRRWLHRLIGPGADLDDATQDALIAIARALPRFEGRSSLRTFAYRITVRVAYRALEQRRARNQREASLELVAPPADELDPESRAVHREALRRLHRVLDRLPPKRRIAFVLCAIEGFEPSEAAEIAGTSSLLLRSRLFHARREIERRLAHDPYVSRVLEGGGR